MKEAADDAFRRKRRRSNNREEREREAKASTTPMHFIAAPLLSALLPSLFADNEKEETSSSLPSSPPSPPSLPVLSVSVSFVVGRSRCCLTPLPSSSPVPLLSSPLPPPLP